MDIIEVEEFLKVWMETEGEGQGFVGMGYTSYAEAAGGGMSLRIAIEAITMFGGKFRITR